MPHKERCTEDRRTQGRVIMQRHETTPLRIRDIRFGRLVPEVVLRYDHVPGIIRVPLREGA